VVLCVMYSSELSASSMAVQSKLIDALPADYGYVVITAVGSVFVNMWMAINVIRARKTHNVKVCLFIHFYLHCPVEMIKPFFNKTSNHFVETGNLPVIGLRDVMCHMAAVLKGRQSAK